MTGATPTNDLVYDPHDDEVACSPWEVFHRLRNEAPLYYNDALDFYALSRFEDVKHAHINRDS